MWSAARFSSASVRKHKPLQKTSKRNKRKCLNVGILRLNTQPRARSPRKSARGGGVCWQSRAPTTIYRFIQYFTLYIVVKGILTLNRLFTARHKQAEAVKAAKRRRAALTGFALVSALAHCRTLYGLTKPEPHLCVWGRGMGARAFLGEGGAKRSRTAKKRFRACER